jgi:hypothetical protein
LREEDANRIVTPAGSWHFSDKLGQNMFGANGDVAGWTSATFGLPRLQARGFDGIFCCDRHKRLIARDWTQQGRSF